MTRDQFIARLRGGLANMPPEAIEDIVSDYEAHFADGAAAGRTEDQVAEALGDPDRLARDLRAAAPSKPWEEPRQSGRDQGRYDAGRDGRGRDWRGYRPGRYIGRMGSFGLLGWILMAIGVVVAAIVLLHVFVALVVIAIPVIIVVGLIAVIVAGLGAIFGFGPFHRGHWDSVQRSFEGPVDASGPQTSRSFSWSGGDRLRVSVPAEVSFTQSATVALSVTGPSGALDRLVIDHGEIRYDRWIKNGGRLKIVLSAPDVTDFQVTGSADMTIDKYNQERLRIRIAGHGVVKASGSARTANLIIAGKGDIDLGQLKGEAVKVEIAGSGAAIIAPTEIAEVGIAGSGLVTLLTNPPVVKSRIAGAGRIVHA